MLKIASSVGSITYDSGKQQGGLLGVVRDIAVIGRGTSQQSAGKTMHQSGMRVETVVSGRDRGTGSGEGIRMRDIDERGIGLGTSQARSGSWHP